MIGWSNLLNLLSSFYYLAVFSSIDIRSIRLLGVYCFKFIFLLYHISKYYPLELWFQYYHCWFLTCLCTLIGSSFIYPNTCPWVWFKTICGAYPNHIYIFSFPAGFWQVVTRVTVACNLLLILIYYFDWSNISFKLFSQDFLCRFLTCLFFIYWISVHWSWNLSLGLIENFLWVVSKPGIRIWFPWSYVEVHGEGVGCVAALLIINWLNAFKLIIPMSSF